MAKVSGIFLFPIKAVSKVYEKIKRDKADFTPAGLRGIGTR